MKELILGCNSARVLRPQTLMYAETKPVMKFLSERILGHARGYLCPHPFARDGNTFST